MLRNSARALLIMCFLLIPAAVRAQITAIGDDTSVPIPGVGHDYIKMLDETVNPANGSVSLRIQVPMPKGRGITIPFGFDYDSNGVDHLVGGGPGASSWKSNTSYLAQGGWSYGVPQLNSSSYSVQGSSGPPANNSWTCYYSVNFMLQDANGGRHPYAVGVASIVYENGYNVCNPDTNFHIGGDEQTTILLNASQGILNSATATDRDGTVYNFGYPQNHSQGNYNLYTSLPTYIEDRNGNKLIVNDTTTNNLGIFSMTDTVGRTVISSSGFGPSGTTNTVSVAGLSSPYQITWETRTAKFTVPVSVIYVAPGYGTCAGISNVDQTQVVVQSITLPNGQKYQFKYWSVEEGDGANSWGLLKEIIYPTGATVNYTWTMQPNTEYAGLTATTGTVNGCRYQYGTPVVATRTVSFNGSTPALTQSFSYSPTVWASGGETWTTKVTKVSTTDNILGKTSLTTYTYGGSTTFYAGNNPFSVSPYSISGQIPTESEVQYYDWGNTTTPLRTVNKTWYEVQAMANQQTVLDNGQSSNTVYCYVGTSCSPNLPIIQLQKKSEYDFGGSLLRTTQYSYQNFSGTLAPITNRPCSATTSDGSGNLVAETDYWFDGTSPTSSVCGTDVPIATASVTGFPNSTHDDSNFGPSSTVPRGNFSAVSHKCLQTCTNSLTTYTYDETGQVLTKTDACGNATCSDMTATSHTTTYSYLDNYDSPPATNTNAYLTKITNALSQSSSFEYAYSDGQLIKSTDPNTQSTSYSYADSLRRLTETDYPDTGKTTLSYIDTPPSPSITSSHLMNSSGQYVTTVSIMDGIGHVVETLVTTDPDCASGDRTDTVYYGTDKVKSVSNPYCSTGDPIYGLTTYAYDALGRTKTVTHPDSTAITSTYTGRATEVQDEGNGNGTQLVTRISQSDALGRLSSVCEVSSTTLPGQGGSPAACGQDIGATGFLTTYLYDTLDDLTSVTQGTLASRSFNYDSLSRLTSASNPESGSISYTYDANGNLSTKIAPAPNQTGTATVTTTYQYDALNRMTQKSYSDGTTPTASFLYDASFAGGDTLTNTVGRLVEISTNTTSDTSLTLSSYDVMGRIVEQVQQTPQTSQRYVLPYAYDLMGNMTSASDGYFQTYGYTYNGAARLTGMTTTNGTPTTLLSTAKYNAAGQLTSDSLGDGEIETFAFDKRLRPTSALSTYNAATTYSYGITQYAPNSDILASTDFVNGTWNYSYDAFNRLTCSNLPSNGTCASPTSGTPTFSYTYDRYGNRLNQTGPITFDATFTGNNNRLDGYSYDSAGNLLSDKTSTYTYDAENRLIKVVNSNGTATYTYDANGRRVHRTGYTATTCTSGGVMDYIYDLSGRWILQVNNGGTACGWEVYAGGRHLGSNRGGMTFSHSDWLGTERVRINSVYVNNPATYERCSSLPFGDGLSCTPAGTDPGPYTSPLHFTGKERDSESGLDNFGARYDASSMGRFMSPDWSEGPDTVPYADFGNPQTTNLYTYAGNNPTTFNDPNGHSHTVCDPPTVVFHDTGAVVTAAPCRLESDWWDIPAAWDRFVRGGNWLRRTTASVAATVFSRSLGARNGARAGKRFTLRGRNQIIEENANANGGQTTCVNCGRPTTPAQQSQAGVTPPDNETNIDHIDPASQGGNGDPSNGQLLCRACNIEKSDSPPVIRPGPKFDEFGRPIYPGQPVGDTPVDVEGDVDIDLDLPLP
jgi:RHS repeat-associated protein